MRLSQIAAGLFSLLVLCGGCVVPVVKLDRPHADPIGDRKNLEAVSFVANINASGLLDEQLIYGVRLLDKMYQPLHSNDGHYENAKSEVSATRTLMILESPWQVENMAVTIPAQELHVKEEDLPVAAEFIVSIPTGEVLAREMVRVPLMPGWDESGPHIAWAPEAVARRVAAANKKSEPLAEQAEPETKKEAPAQATEEKPVARKPPPADSRRVVRGSRDAKPIAPGSTDKDIESAKPTRSTNTAKPPPSTRKPKSSPTDEASTEGDASATKAPPKANRPTTAKTPPSATEEAEAVEPAPQPKPPATKPAPTGDKPREKPTAPSTGARRTASQPVASAPAETQPAKPAETEAPATKPAPKRGPVTPPRPTNKPTEPPASQPTTQASRPALREYVVKSGDNLFTIAEHELGDAQRWLEIYELNRDRLNSPDELQVGLKLRLPPK